jgi:four helix bundle protein
VDTVQDYRQIRVWQRSHDLVLAIHRATQTFPASERFGLTSQLRRAALSVPTNLAEGCRRLAPREYAHVVNIAEGSLSETEYLVLVARDLGYLFPEMANPFLAEAATLLKMLSALRKQVQQGVSVSRAKDVRGQPPNS